MAIWRKLKNSPCADQFSARINQKINLNIAVADSNLTNIARLSEELLVENIGARDQALIAGMTAYIGQGDRQQAKKLWEAYGASIEVNEKSELLVRLLKAHASVKTH